MLTCTHTHIYIHLHTNMHIYMHKPVNLQVSMYIYIFIDMIECVGLNYMRIYIYACVYIYIYRDIYIVYVCSVSLDIYGCYTNFYYTYTYCMQHRLMVTSRHILQQEAQPLRPNQGLLEQLAVGALSHWVFIASQRHTGSMKRAMESAKKPGYEGFVKI